MQDSPARRLVNPAAFHPDETVLHHVDPSDAVFAAKFVEHPHDHERTQLLPVSLGPEFLQHLGHTRALQSGAVAFGEMQNDPLRLVRRIFRRRAQTEHVLVLLVARVEPRVLQDPALVADMEKIAVRRIRLLCRDRHRDAVRLGVGDHFGASGEFFPEPLLPPRRDHFQFRSQGRRRQLEPHLVIPLARRPVGHCGRTLGPRDLHHALGDERAGNARAEKILTLVNRPGTDHGENEIPGKLLLQIIDKTFRRPRAQRLGLEPVEFLLLPDIGAEGNDLRPVSFLQPLQQHRGVQAARISTYDLHLSAFLPRPPPSGNAARDLPGGPPPSNMYLSL